MKIEGIKVHGRSLKKDGGFVLEFASENTYIVSTKFLYSVKEEDCLT